MKRVNLAISGLCVAAALSSAASAVVIPPGGVVVPPGTSFDESPWLGSAPLGSAVYNETRRVTSPSGQVANIDVVVFRRVTGAFAEFTHDTYWIGSTSQAVRPVQITLDGYRGLDVNTDWRTDQIFIPSAIVTKITRSADGDLLIYDIGNVQTTSFLIMPIFVFTDTTGFDNTGELRIELNTGQTVVFTGVPSPIAPCEGDSNGDGVINFVDLNGVLTNFGQPCP